ncbi:ATP phosphoribosyltransferase [Candidatus Hodgkinia cicadicola]
MALNTLALPSKGRVGEALPFWLAKLGLKYSSLSSRRYQNEFVGYPSVGVVLMPAADIAKALIDGEVHFGLTGLDLVSEYGYGRITKVGLSHKFSISEAVVSVLVPKCWVGVNALSDLSLLSLAKQPVKVSTKYVNLTRRFLNSNYLSFFEVVRSVSSTELEPVAGKCDFVVDIVSTGGTARANGLKRLVGGTVLISSLCLFYNASTKFGAEALSLMRLLGGLPAL